MSKRLSGLWHQLDAWRQRQRARRQELRQQRHEQQRLLWGGPVEADRVLAFSDAILNPPCPCCAFPPGGLWLPAVPAQAGSFLFHDGVVHVPQVGASAAFGMGLVLVVAVLRQAGTFPRFFHDGVVHVPEVGASAPLGVMLVLGVFVDSHRPHPSSGGTPTVVRDRPKRTLGTILPPGRSQANLLLG